MAEDPELARATRRWFDLSYPHKYSYNFTWLGRPVIQYPQDLIALQEIIWRTRPDVIVETGIAHGGLTIFLASMLELLGADGLAIGIDVDIRPHNRAAIDKHPLRDRLTLVEGSSVDQKVVDRIRDEAAGRNVMVILDSDHTHEHVRQELDAYSPLVSAGGYVVVFDTVVELMAADAFPDRPWGRGNNPLTAVREFLKTNDRFVTDRDIEDSLLITAAPSGYLRCIRD